MPAPKYLTLLATFLTLSAYPCLADDATYKLGPEEKLSIKVWDIRNGEAFQWVALNDEFTIGADGNIILPLIGRIRAAGMSVEEFASDVGESLKRKVGLSIKPEAAVQITKYRPFYIIGAVQKPGRFEFQPGLTVLQAVSIAEGAYKDSSSLTYSLEKDSLLAQGDMQNLTRERVSLLAKQSRLSSEISGSNRIVFVPDLMSKMANDFISKTKDEETMLFNGRRESLNAQLAAIEEAKAVLSSQLNSLSAKELTLSRQLDLTRKDLIQVSDLVAKGMAVAPRKLSAEQSVAAFESSQLDVQLARLKAQQDYSQAERDSIDLRTKFRTGALSDLTDVRAKIAVIERRIATAGKLNESAKSATKTLSRNDDISNLKFTIVRQHSQEEKGASAFDMLEPGDVLSVFKKDTQINSADADRGIYSDAESVGGQR
jgi:exopolysaccharide production protein ExoF